MNGPDLSTREKRNAYFDQLLAEAIANPSDGTVIQHRKGRSTEWRERADILKEQALEEDKRVEKHVNIATEYERSALGYVGNQLGDKQARQIALNNSDLHLQYADTAHRTADKLRKEAARLERKADRHDRRRSGTGL